MPQAASSPHGPDAACGALHRPSADREATASPAASVAGVTGVRAKKALAALDAALGRRPGVAGAARAARDGRGGRARRSAPASTCSCRPAPAPASRSATSCRRWPRGKRVVVATATKALQAQLVDKDLPRLVAALAPVLGRTPDLRAGQGPRQLRLPAAGARRARRARGRARRRCSTGRSPRSARRSSGCASGRGRPTTRRPRRGAVPGHRPGLAPGVGQRPRVPRQQVPGPGRLLRREGPRGGQGGRRRRRQPHAARARRLHRRPGAARARRGGARRGARVRLLGHRRAVARAVERRRPARGGRRHATCVADADASTGSRTPATGSRACCSRSSPAGSGARPRTPSTCSALLEPAAGRGLQRDHPRHVRRRRQDDDVELARRERAKAGADRGRRGGAGDRHAVGVVSAVYATADGATTRLRVSPLRVGGALGSRLFGETTVVATSATLTLGGSFRHAARAARADLAGRLAGRRAASRTTGASRPRSTRRSTGDEEQPAAALDAPRRRQPVRLRRGSRQLWVARHLPDPGRMGVSWAARGRRAARRAGRRPPAAARSGCSARPPPPPAPPRPSARRPTCRCCCRARTRPGALQHAFASDARTCLFGTRSFWQGVDTPGSACQLVVIDRIPFGHVDDPLSKARLAAASDAGRNGFLEVTLPPAAVLLAQGAGRLVRATDDRGVVAVLDPRLETAGYAGMLLDSLPAVLPGAVQGGGARLAARDRRLRAAAAAGRAAALRAPPRELRRTRRRPPAGRSRGCAAWT